MGFMLDYEASNILLRFPKLRKPVFVINCDEMDEEEFDDLFLIVNMIMMILMKIGYRDF